MYISFEPMHRAMHLRAIQLRHRDSSPYSIRTAGAFSLSAALLLSTAALIIPSTANATCALYGSAQYVARGSGEDCISANPTFNVYNNSRGEDGLMVDGGATLTIRTPTGAPIDAYANAVGGSRHGTSISFRGGATGALRVEGHLDTRATNTNNGRGLMISRGGSAEITGNLTAVRSGGSGGAATEVEAGASLTVRGNTSMSSNIGGTFRSYGQTLLQGNFTGSTTAAGAVINSVSGAETRVMGTMALSASVGTGISSTGGLILSEGETTITSSGSAVYLTQGTVALGGTGHSGLASNTLVAVGSTASITSSASNAISVGATGSSSVVVDGTLRGGTGGAAVTLSTAAGNVSEVQLRSGSNSSAASGRLITGGDGDTTVTIYNGATAAGSISLGAGSDRIILDGMTDLSGLTTFDLGDDVDIADGMIDTFQTRNANLSLIGANILNAENVEIDGGRVSFSDNILTTSLGVGQGLKVLNGGTFAAGSSFALTGNMDVGTGSFMQASGGGTGVYTVSGSVGNAGTISLADGAVGDQLRVAGDYVGNGGVLQLDTFVDADGSPSDLLDIAGNASGTTAIAVTNVGGMGRPTTGDGIEVVRLGGTSTGTAFNLQGQHVDVGAYEYRLYRSATTTANDNWYLRSSLIETAVEPPVTPPVTPPVDPTPSEVIPQPEPIVTYRQEVPLYTAVEAELHFADATMIGNMHQRIGQTPKTGNLPVWGRLIANSHERRSLGEIAPQTKSRSHGLQLGIDLYEDSSWKAGVYAGYLRSNSSVTGFASGQYGYVGDINANSYSLGAYATHLWEDGSYLDLVLQASRHDAKLFPLDNPGARQRAIGLTLSGEYGKPFAMGQSGWMIEPQAQLVLHRLDMKNEFIGNAGIQHDGSTGGYARLGARVFGSFETVNGKFEPYSRINFYKELGSGNQVSFVNGDYRTAFATPKGDGRIEFALGGNMTLNNGADIYGEISKSQLLSGSNNGTESLMGSIGIRHTW